MFTLIFNITSQARRSITALGLLVLTLGCVPGVGLDEYEIEQAHLGDGVVLTLPRGMCFDADHNDLANGFALATACDRFDDGAHEGLPFYVTVQKSELGGALIRGQEEQAAELLRQSAAQTSLQNLQVPAEAWDVKSSRNRVFLTSGIGATAQWRGFMDVGDSLVVVTVRTLPELVGNAREGRRLRDKVLASISERAS